MRTNEKTEVNFILRVDAGDLRHFFLCRNQEDFISESIFFAFFRSLEKIFSSIPPSGFKPTTFSSVRKDSIPSSRSLFWAKLAANESLKILTTTISSLLCVIIYCIISLVCHYNLARARED